MTMTSRERVRRCLTFTHPDRMPRELWVLPWAGERYAREIAELSQRFPGDFGGTPQVYRPSPRVAGDPYAIGNCTDEWGCCFTSIQAGVIGEVRTPMLADIADWRMVRPPYEILPEDRQAARDAVNRCCAASTAFVRAGCCPRPWERYQFLRGSEAAMMDVMDMDADVRGLLRAIHDFYLAEFEFWVSTDVDAVNFMDDWGSQRQLLIPPAIWRELFKPLYRDYCALAHAHGKFIFMHSDGMISEIYDDLVEIGVDAVNSQLACMDLCDLRAKGQGRITFWGEIDRQHVLVADDPQVGRDAVRAIAEQLYDPAGGIIAQFELGPGCNPAVALAVMEEWDAVQREAGGCDADQTRS